MGKATGIVASIGLTLGGMIAGHFMGGAPAAVDVGTPVAGPLNITSLDDLQRVRNATAQQVMNPATGKPDAYGTVQAWVEQQQQKTNSAQAR